MFALLAVGANPLYVIYGLGGAHNDLIMMLAMMAAVEPHARPTATRAREAAPPRGRRGRARQGDGRRAAAVHDRSPGAGSRRSSGRSPRSRSARSSATRAFGIHGIDVVSALNRDAAFVSTDSFANEIAHLFGKPGVFPVDHDLLKAALVLIVLHLLWRTWRGYDWVAASGWALLAISVTSTWLLAWYILWPLPLAVVTRDRRLLVATLASRGCSSSTRSRRCWCRCNERAAVREQ